MLNKCFGCGSLLFLLVVMVYPTKAQDYLIANTDSNTRILTRERIGDINFPKGVHVLTYNELQQIIIGNTTSEPDQSAGWAEFYTKTGEIKGRDYYGNWILYHTPKGGIMCFRYLTDNICSTLSISGNTITYYNVKGFTKGKGILHLGNFFNFN